MSVSTLVSLFTPVSLFKAMRKSFVWIHGLVLDVAVNRQARREVWDLV